MRTNGQGRDNPIALAYASKLFRLNAEQQIPGMSGVPIHFLGGPEGPALAHEHGEMGVLQTFIPNEMGDNPLIGGGNARSFTDAVSREPNSVGLSAVALQLMNSDDLKTARL
jgi:hypothetical protein